MGCRHSQGRKQGRTEQHARQHEEVARRRRGASVTYLVGDGLVTRRALHGGGFFLLPLYSPIARPA